MTIHVDALDEDDGVRVRDTAEGEQFPLRTDRAVDPTPASTDVFTMPVDAAFAVEARELHAPVFVAAVFWQDGEVVHRAESDESVERLPRGTYEVDFSPPGGKLYVRVEDATPTVRTRNGRTALRTETPTRMVLGVRSFHETPAGTVTTTDDPRDLMRAVSTMGSALKTQSPDRSWPTLRGHPPAIERGGELYIPEEVSPPETGVRIEVPPEYGAIYTVAPLAYYLGATVEPGGRPRLVAAGETYEFDTTDLAGDVRSVLEHVFALDCAVRTAGVYPFRTATVDELEDRVTLDYERLFELPLGDRTAEYLDVPRSATEGLLDWHYTADVAADPTYAPALPYLLDDLALVRSPPQRASAVDLSPSPNALQSADSALARSASETSPTMRSVVVPEDAGTPGHAWVAPGHAVRAANPTVGSFRRDISAPADDPLDVHVVFNDARLQRGDVSLFDSHPYQETNVRVSRDLSTTELREALYEDVDYFHFVGHVTDSGMVCPDGTLDTRTLARTGVQAFFLNGCRSYEQGRALLTAGAAGGIATVDDVADGDARSVGEMAAVLLSAGFPLYGILDALELAGTPADRYTILGDGRSGVRRSYSNISVLHVFDTDAIDAASGAWPMSIRHYPHGKGGVGGMTAYAHTDTSTDVHDASVRETTLPQSALEAFFGDTGIPVLVDGTVRLTDHLAVEEFR
ncbi:hypothetical protein [Halobacterium sp. R2-5]|uniref:hypothetical protein n=1 Tax=Halobacterium sp. R2-5 TaxID=2715751 RepID=UPI0014229722|nr:hypothetical protein [Halobacterium sp. R2-5]NIB99669.1 hypothetical protein [Halobacterium sp. R2-5]